MLRNLYNFTFKETPLSRTLCWNRTLTPNGIPIQLESRWTTCCSGCDDRSVRFFWSRIIYLLHFYLNWKSFERKWLDDRALRNTSFINGNRMETTCNDNSETHKINSCAASLPFQPKCFATRIIFEVEYVDLRFPAWQILLVRRSCDASDSRRQTSSLTRWSIVYSHSMGGHMLQFGQFWLFLFPYHVDIQSDCSLVPVFLI